MLKQTIRIIATATVLLLLSGLGLAQVTTGIPPFESFGGGPDVINLGNLNVHIAVPVFSRAGRGMSFYYGLAYDSSVWQPAGSVWVPSGSTWGLTRDIPAAVGVVTGNVMQGHCIDHYNGNTVYYNKYWYSGYYDSAGTLHRVTLTMVTDDDGTCLANPQYSATLTTTDGSAMTLYVDANPSASVTLKSGSVIKPPVSFGSATTGTSTDANGNQITASTVSGTTSLYDTLSSTTAVLKITGTAPSNVSYAYTSPSGANAPVTVSYRTYTVQTYFNCSGISEYGPTNNSLVDKITLPDGSYYQFSYEKTPISGNNNVTGRVASVQLPLGGTISYTYSGGNNGIMCSDGSTAGFTRQTPDGSWTYSRTGTSPNYTTTVTDPVGNTSAITFSGEYETNRVIKDSSNNELETIATCYNGSCSTAPVTPFTQINSYRSLGGVYSAQTLVYYNGYGLPTYSYYYGWNSGSWQLLRYDTTVYASLGNNINDHPSEILIRDGATHTKAQTNFSYDEYTLQTTTGSPNHTSITGARGNVTTVTSYTSASTTLVSHVHYYDTGMPYQTTDVNGAVTTYNYSSSTASCGNAFPTSVSLPVGSLSRSMAWNCTGAVMTALTDESGNTSYINYTADNYFWRPESTKDPMGNVTSLSYPSKTQVESVLSFNSGNSAVDVLTTRDSLGRAYLTQSRQAPGSTNFDSTEIHYGATGLPNWTSVPYVAAAGAFAPTGTPTTSPYWDGLGRLTKTVAGSYYGPTTLYTYPNLNDAYVSVTPAPTGENTKDRQLEYDATGRVTSVCEITSVSGSGTCGQLSTATGFWTKYAYDNPTNSMAVTQSAQGSTSQSRTYQYDLMGRMTSETNPESGTASYVYDTDSTCGTYNGDLVKRTDAVGNVTCYAYDQLHRLTSITYPSGSYAGRTAQKHFVYDSATVNGVSMSNAGGRLAEAYTGTSGSKTTDLGYNYNARGELVDYYESTPHSGGYFTVCVRNWENGAPRSVNCLAGLPLIYYGASDGSGLDGEGRITKVTAQSGQNPVSSVTYDTAGATQPVGALTQITFGDNDSDSFSYDLHTLRLTQYQYNDYGVSGSDKGTLTWNTNGTLGSLAVVDAYNAATNETCNYGYDDLARLGSVSCATSNWAQNFTFDTFGNIKKAVPTGYTGITFNPNYSTSPSNNHFSSIPGVSVTYDSNGNLTSDGNNYVWDSENKPTSINSYNVTYDALGRAVELSYGSSHTEIVYGPDGTSKLALMNGTGTLVTGFIALPSGATAVYKPGVAPAYYRHADWLGSSRLSIQTGHTKYFDSSYAPFGENYAGATGTGGAVDLKFTGANQDIISGLYDFLYREYHPVQGRWISPDPAGLAAVDMTNPQTWNRYAYVGNNPTGVVDPLGLFGSDAVQYMLAMARTAGFFNRFEFFDIWQWKTSNGEREFRWAGFVGPGGQALNSRRPQTPAEVRMMQKVSDYLKKCGNLGQLAASTTGTIKMGTSMPSRRAGQTSPDANDNAQMVLNPNVFDNAPFSMQVGLVAHEWAHTLQIDANPAFTVGNAMALFEYALGLGNSVEKDAEDTKNEILSQCPSP
jgi:RHS repeat-associated protein